MTAGPPQAGPADDGAAPRAVPGFWVALAIGWAMIGFGVAQTFFSGGIGRTFEVGTWVVGLDLVHDLAFAPVAWGVALAVVLWAPPVARGPLLGALGASACVLLLAWPLLGGYGRDPRNPTILPLDYGTAVATVLAVVWAGAATWLAVRLVRGSRRRSLSPAVADAPDSTA